MGETGDTIRPIWRTPLFAVLVAWMLLVVGLMLASWRIAETTPLSVYFAMLVLVGPLSAVALLVWGFWTMLREPVTGWIAPTALLTFCGALVPASQPLTDAAAQLNFASHRAVYDQIVADARAGHLAPDRDGRVDRMRDGVRFHYDIARPVVIEFPWVRTDLIEAGVRYNDIPCKPAPGMKCIDRGRPLAPGYFHYQLMF